jgi:F0F1-type ATP synthase assembly protein I
MRCTSLGWDLALPIAGGVLIGHALDRRLQTGMVWTVALLFLGVVVGYANVMRRLHDEIERDRRRREGGEPQ